MKFGLKQIICLYLLLFTSILCYSDETSSYPFKTKYYQTIESPNAFIDVDHGKPSTIAVNNITIFQTIKEDSGDYEPLYFAGDPYAFNAAQIVKINGVERCYRWVIQVGWATHTKYYVIDFTEPSAAVVGPFTVPEPSDKVKAVYWGRNYALIKFESWRNFKYYYKEKTVVED